MILFTKNKSSQSGVIALFTMLIGTVVVTSISITLLLSGILGAQISLELEDGSNARAGANACAEEALAVVWTDGVGTTASNDDTASGSLLSSKWSCTYEVLDTGNEDRVIQSSGISGIHTRMVEVEIGAIDPIIIIESWQEVAEFNF